VQQLNAKWSAVRLPKIGEVKFRDTRPLRGTIRNATVSLATDGWHIAFACQIEHDAPANVLPAIGVDRGVANTLTLSTGERMSLPGSLEMIERRKRKAQHVLARRKRGSRRYAKQRHRLARLQARAARIRKDWLHRASLDLSSRFGVVAIETLHIGNMTASTRGTVEEPGRNVRAKAGLNRSILAQGWYALEAMLAYKLEERGGRLVKVNPAFTSQTCSACWFVDAKSRESQAAFVCVACGHREHADVNAAVNILRRNTALKLVESSHQRLREARTGRAVSA
jgi:putative transposase